MVPSTGHEYLVIRFLFIWSSGFDLMDPTPNNLALGINQFMKSTPGIRIKKIIKIYPNKLA